MLEKKGQGNKAEQLYNEAIKLKPDEAKIHHNLGINLKRSGNLKDALSHYK